METVEDIEEEMFGPPEAKSEVVLSPLQKARLTEAAHREKVTPYLRELEDQILQESGELVHDALQGFSLDESGKLPPEATEGLDEARRRKREQAARMAMLPTKEAPYALKMAESLYSSISRGRMKTKGSERTLNMQVVIMPAVNTTYPELEVGEDK